MASGTKSVKNPRAIDRRQLRRIAEHEQRHVERHQIAAELGIDHRAFVDHDQLRLRGRRIVPEIELRNLLAALPRPVDQAVNGRGAVAAFVAHHLRRLAGEGGKQHLAVDAFGDMLGERGLACAGIAEQPEDAGRPFRPGLALSQEATDFSAESWCGVKMVMEGKCLPPESCSYYVLMRRPQRQGAARSSLRRHAHSRKRARALVHVILETLALTSIPK